MPTTYEIRLAPSAEQDIDEAASYLVDHAPELVGDWLRDLKNSIESLGKMPERCPMAPENGLWGEEPLHQLLFDDYPSKYRILFTIDEDTQEVRVLNVRHGARQYLYEE